MNRRPLLCVAGDLVEDVVVWPQRPIVAGTDNPCRVHRTRGGSAANVAALAAPLVRTRFVGCVGDDPTGDGLERALTASGVEVCLERRGRTGSVVVVVEPDGERTMFPDRAAASELSADAARWATDVDVLHLPAYAFERGSTATSVVAMADVVRAAGGAVTVDASAASLVAALGAEELMALLAALGASVLFANRDEADALGLPARPLPPGLTAVVKDGPRPVTILIAGADPVSVAVRPVDDVRDTTGAGDAFAAGTLAAWMSGAELPAACAAGNTVAASVLATPGAVTPQGAPT